MIYPKDVVDIDKYFNEKLNRLSNRDYTNLMLQFVRRPEIEIREFDRQIDELLAKK